MNYQTLLGKYTIKIKGSGGWIFCLLIPLLCVLRYYQSPIGLLANRLSVTTMIIMVVLIPLFLPKHTNKANPSTAVSFVVLCITIICCYVFSLLLYDFVAKRALVVLEKQLYAILVAILCFYCMQGRINYHLLTKLYVKLACFFALAGIVQWVVGCFGVGIDIKIPFLEYYNGGEKFTLFSQMNTFTHVPSAFAEASHFAAFLLPAVIFLLAKYETKHRIFKLIILLMGVGVSTSANGLICLVIICVSYLYFFQGKLSKNRIVIGLVLIVLAFLVLCSGVLSNILDGVFLSTESSATKADFRIYRGFELFGKLPIHQKVIGIGNANIQSFYAEGLMSSRYDRDWRAIDFLSAISSILIYSGLIGMIAYIFFMKALWKKSNWATKTLILAFVCYSISEDFYFNEYWLLYISLICSARYVFANRSRDAQIYNVTQEIA